ncbi:MAG TPA: metal ABC transporter substrate-binding protein, partial [Thermomicrobiales bacterium]|nr:metal ABC transporter substrate-binding protein [Thermomicrobiales bacterium]
MPTLFRSRRDLLRTGMQAGLGFALIGRFGRAAAQDATPAVPASSLGWSDSFEADSGKLNVATTVAPISSIVRNVGGTRIDVHGIVPDGTNSHTFEPAPSDAILLSQADLLIVNGLDLEDPTIDLAEANLKDGAEIYSLGDKTITPDQYAYDFSFPEEEGHPNPHLWPNVPFAMTYAELVAAKLSERDPANAGYYQENLARYLAVLTQLDQPIVTAVQTIPEGQRKL